jgi:hydroxymethylpyrimidine/phosphomethylpyrimidine kinase
VKTLIAHLLPLALVVTPNVPEAEVLWGQRIAGLTEMRQAAQRIHSLGSRYVVLKGGHLGIRAIDLLYDGSTFTMLDAERIDTPHTHGTGCVFSAAIAAELAKGSSVPDAVATAKRFITAAIHYGFPLGKGVGPTDPMAAARSLTPS